MSPGGAPEWLADFQARFGALIRTPLDRSTGTLRAACSRYEPALCDGTRGRPGVPAAERLATYNRQYWFRLLDLMNDAYPLAARLLGSWTFNGHAAAFLVACPPVGWNVDRAAEGFEAFLAGTLRDARVPLDRSRVTVERDALLQAVRIDAAYRGVFVAPAVTPYRPATRDAERLLASRLVPSPAVAVIEEHWPLLELRRTLLGDPAEAPVALPPRHPGPRWWALVRRPTGIGQLPLESREGELLGLLRDHPVADALARLEARCSEAERAELPAKAQVWLARSVELDCWQGHEEDPASLQK